MHSAERHHALRTIARRSFLTRSSLGLGSAALAYLFAGNRSFAAGTGGHGELGPHPPGAVYPLHVPPRAKRVIFLCMAGGPSHLETLDYKPELARMDGKPMPESFTQGKPIAQLQGQQLRCLGPQFPFSRCGESGQLISDALPSLQTVADDICIVRSLHTTQINHDPAHTVLNTGTSISGRPSMGSWVWYGLGSANENLPAFVVLTSVGGRNPQPIASRQWHSGFLPSRYHGVEFHSQGDPVHYIQPPGTVTKESQQRVIDAVAALDRASSSPAYAAEIEARISQYELAFRMQTSVPELTDFRDEPKHVLDMYGSQGADGSFAANCLLARRLAERGVRFVQLYHRGWDHHGDLVRYMDICTGLCDGPSAALLRDLKQRGMLEDTLVIWGGEFGRTPMFQGKGKDPGRDHHIQGYSMWLAGGGVRGGISYGATDELGYAAVEDKVHVHDLHATMLHLLGINHRRLTVRHQGRDFRLTDVHGKVVDKILLRS